MMLLTCTYNTVHGSRLLDENLKHNSPLRIPASIRKKVVARRGAANRTRLISNMVRFMCLARFARISLPHAHLVFTAILLTHTTPNSQSKPAATAEGARPDDFAPSAIEDVRFMSIDASR